MPNRAIYGNTCLHKSYLRTKVFIDRKNRFLLKDLRKILCKALIQPCFDCACAAWYPNLNTYKNKLQVLQNKCICFCLQLDSGKHTETEHFDKINWLPIDLGFK